MLKLDIGEIKRYLNDESELLDEQVKQKIEKYSKWLLQEAKMKHIYQRCGMELVDDLITVEGLQLAFRSKDLSAHLNGCDEIVIFVATLGVGVDQKIRELELDELSDAYILNAVAIEMIEKYCDEIQAEIQEAVGSDLFLTSRYSCGYGDFALAYQNDLIHNMQAKKLLGVDILENHLMIPSKTVSAIIGISKHKQVTSLKKCSRCLENGKCSGLCLRGNE